MIHVHIGSQFECGNEIVIGFILAMSESPEVCQFSSTEAISTHCYNASASN